LRVRCAGTPSSAAPAVSHASAVCIPLASGTKPPSGSRRLSRWRNSASPGAKTKARTRARANPRARARTANGGGSSLELRRAQLEWIFLFRFFFWLLFVGLLLDGRGLGRAAEPLAAPEQPLEQRRGLVGVAEKLDAARQLDHHAARAILDGGGEDRRRLAALGVAAAQRAIAHF